MRYFKCVGYNTDERYFTLGKVYETSDDTRGMTTDDGHTFDFFTVNDLGAWYNFVEVNIAPVRNHTIKIVTDGRKTIAQLYDDMGTIVRRAYCVCHEDDAYNFETGADIAMKRLFDKNYKRSKRPRFFVRDRVEVVDPAQAELYDISFFAYENIDYFDDFLYGEEVNKGDFGTIVAKKGDMCLIDKATFVKGHYYILVNEKGLKKL